MVQKKVFSNSKDIIIGTNPACTGINPIEPKPNCGNTNANSDIINRNEIVVKPNPNIGSFNVEIPENLIPSIRKIEIIDLIGRKVLIREFEGGLFDYKLSQGTYFMLFYTNDNIFTTKIEIQ